MTIRLASAVVMAALALVSVLASVWTFVALVIAAGVTVAWEWGRLVRKTGFDAIAVIQSVAVAAIAVAIALYRPGLALIAGILALAGTGILGFSSATLGWSLLGIAYSVLPAWSMVWLRSDPTLGATALLYLLLMAWTTDTACYAGGKLIEGPKLAPKISPQKTWSGLVAGTFAPALIGYAFALFLEDTSGWRLALVSVVIAAACQIGDLSESAVKRRFGAKDMSNLIPGHGGLLDRIDGLLLAAIAAALMALRDPANPGRGLLIW
ncbi:MAG TPA: phosphatidate cytidylyltransferase [Methyloceanibacter sp.]|nr:phosphatidate cytidylyltransferase [Methyloceanibacter sp.]